MGAILTPDSGAPQSPTDPIVFDVTDADEALTDLLISLRHDTGIVELVHDGTAFTAFYSAGSTRTPITDGFRFSIVRVGGWTDASVSISAYPFAGTGVGLINFSSDFEVLEDPPGEDVALAVTGVTGGTYGDAAHVGRFTTDSKGRLSDASSITISIPSTAISDSTSAGRALLTAANAAAQRTALGLVIGTDVQAQDAELSAIAGLASAANKLPYFTGSGTAALADLTAAGRALIDDADASAQRTTLGLVIGTDVQAQDAELAAIAGLTSAADRLPYFTGSGTASLATFTAAGRALVDDADASAQRTTLGLGTIATQAAASVSITGGSVTGITDLAIADGGTNASSAVAAADNLNTKSTNIASASTTDLSTATGTLAHITGTTTITAFGTVAAGAERVLVFDGVLTLTHNATSLILPGAANIITAAGDIGIFRSEGSGNWRCVGFVRAANAPQSTGSASWGGSIIDAAGGFYEDWAPTGYADCLMINVTGSASFNLVRGLQGGVDGRIVIIRNGGTTTFQIAIEAGTSSAANRFAEQYSGASSAGYYPTCFPGQSFLFRYSGSASRWIPLILPGLQPNGSTGECQFNYFNQSFQHGASFSSATGINVYTYGDKDTLSMGGIYTVGRIQERKGADTASANEMTLAGYVTGGAATNNTTSGNLYTITGSTTIKGIDSTGWQAGSRVRLTFDSTITIQDGFSPTNPVKTIRTKSGSSLEMQAGEFLTLLYDGTAWYEV